METKQECEPKHAVCPNEKMPIDKVASNYIIALVANAKLDQPHLPREPDGLRPAQKYFKTLP